MSSYTGKIESINEDRTAEVSILGIRRAVSLDLVPTAAVDDFVLIHAGFAIEIVDEVFANETIELIKQFPELAEA